MAGPARQSPFLFVVGCPRSGTTLLQRMLDAHPQLAVANDTHFIPRALEAVQSGSLDDDDALADASSLPKLVAWVRSYYRFARLGLDEASFAQATACARSYREFVSLLYGQLARKHGKELGGEKTPDYVRHLPLLHRLFPWARSVHIIRDGRDVALSILEWACRGGRQKGPAKLALWREEPVATCALWWRWQVRLGRRSRSVLPPDIYQEVRYEALVDDPEAILRSVVAFLGLPFSDRMLSFNDGKVRHEAGLSAKKAWLAPTPGLRDWRTQMTQKDVELFEALAGDLLSELDYPRAFATASSRTREVAECCRAWWERNFETHRALPVGTGSAG
jgi:sulfotransferase family protein